MRNGVNGEEVAEREGNKNPLVLESKGKLTEANWPGVLFGFFLAKEKQNKIKMNQGFWGFSKGFCFPLGGGSARTQRTTTDVVMTNNVIH